MPMLVPYRWMRLTPTEERLRREQVDAIFRAVIPGVIAAALAAVVLAVFLVRLGEAGPTAAGGWATAIVVCAICHVTLALAYRRSPPATRAEKVWPLVFTLFALAEGVAWGLASVVLTPDAAFDVRLTCRCRHHRSHGRRDPRLQPVSTRLFRSFPSSNSPLCLDESS